MIEIVRPDDKFYSKMGKTFASREYINEMDCQFYSNTNMIWVIEYGRGFLSLEDKGNHLWLDNFFVFPGYRASGLGDELLCKSEQLFIKDVKLITRNEAANHLFNRHGFVETGKNGRYVRMEKRHGKA